MVTRHNLKIWPEPFAAVRAGEKPYEIRVNDRGYKFGDELNLQEWNPNTAAYSGQSCLVKVVHITYGGEAPIGQLPANLCVMGIKIIP